MNSEADIRERVTRVETKVDYIIDHMTSLPASPETIKRLEKLEASSVLHSNFEVELNKRIAWVTGAFSIIAAGLGYSAKLIWEKISMAIWGS